MSAQDDVAAIARRHGFSTEAGDAAATALRSGHGRMAQFSHAELGGMGQWSLGMTMIGTMSDRGLKDRVAALFDDLAGVVAHEPRDEGPGDTRQVSGASSGEWWPADLGQPSSTGSQNDMRYALFPERRRLAVLVGGKVSVYDTGERRISGFGQQQGGTQTLSLSGDQGTVALSDLALATDGDTASRARAPEAKPAAAEHDAEAAPPRSAGGHDALGTLERLGDLHRKGILSDTEFAAKKADLLSRI